MTLTYDDHSTQAVTLLPTEAEPSLYMVNPFDEGETAQSGSEVVLDFDQDNELGKYLKWAHTHANPFDPDFLIEVNSAVRGLNTEFTTPQTLAPLRGTVERLDYLIDLLEAERTRLRSQWAEYEAHQKRIVSQYTEEQAEAWLKVNMPQAYERSTRPNFGAAAATATNDPTQSKANPGPQQG